MHNYSARPPPPPFSFSSKFKRSWTRELPQNGSGPPGGAITTLLNYLLPPRSFFFLFFLFFFFFTRLRLNGHFSAFRFSTARNYRSPSFIFFFPPPPPKVDSEVGEPTTNSSGPYFPRQALDIGSDLLNPLPVFSSLFFFSVHGGPGAVTRGTLTKTGRFQTYSFSFFPPHPAPLQKEVLEHDRGLKDSLLPL